MKKVIKGVIKELYLLIETVNEAADRSGIARQLYWVVAVPLILWLFASIILAGIGTWIVELSEWMERLGGDVVEYLARRGK